MRPLQPLVQDGANRTLDCDAGFRPPGPQSWGRGNAGAAPGSSRAFPQGWGLGGCRGFWPNMYAYARYAVRIVRFKQISDRPSLTAREVRLHKQLFVKSEKFVAPTTNASHHLISCSFNQLFLRTQTHGQTSSPNALPNCRSLCADRNHRTHRSIIERRCPGSRQGDPDCGRRRGDIDPVRGHGHADGRECPH